MKEKYNSQIEHRTFEVTTLFYNYIVYNDTSMGPAIFLSFITQNFAIIDLIKEYNQEIK